MLDIKRIINDRDNVERNLLKRMDEVNFDNLIKNYTEKNELLSKVEVLKSEKNKIAKEVGQFKRNKKDATALIEKMTISNKQIDALDTKIKQLEKIINAEMAGIPNIPDDDVLPGDKENNKIVKTFKEKPVFNFKFKDHVELATSLNLIDYERGAKMSGTGFWLYTGIGARLEWAILNYFIDFHTENGYTFILPPHMLNYESGYAAGQFPKFEDDVFHTEENFLIPTSETALINIHRNEIIDEKKLPIKYFAYSPCYRKEAGSSRKEERGMIRGHQFNKVEMFAYCKQEESTDIHNEMVENAEKLVEGLGLHYTTTKLAAKDASSSMAKTYDIEVWIPSMSYKEVSSVSNARCYQARRGKIRYKEEGNIKFAHTLNGSGLATSRLIPAILEQYQNEDGSVTIPEVLRKYMGGIKKITK
ncbi:MAG: serine--tRNA ligase [Bacilli bacterium]